MVRKFSKMGHTIDPFVELKLKYISAAGTTVTLAVRILFTLGQL